jgi:hypothetical protein
MLIFVDLNGKPKPLAVYKVKKGNDVQVIMFDNQFELFAA